MVKSLCQVRKVDLSHSISQMIKHRRIAGARRRIVSTREVIILLVTIGLVILFYFTSYQNRFVCVANLDTMFSVAPELGIIVLGVALLMICGEFDLSVGSVSAVSALIGVQLYMSGLDPFLALVIALGVGAVVGAINGLITVKFGIPSFITTLGAMMLWRGAVYIITAGRAAPFHVQETHPAFYDFFAGTVGGIPIQFIWFLIIGVALALVLNYHRFGNRVYATGGNREAARAMGINVNRTKITCFVLVGVLCAFAGIMRTARIGSFFCAQGEGLNLLAIAATVVGGTSLSGGAGTIIGAFLGVLVLTFLEYGLIMSRVPGFWFKAVSGILIIVVVIMNSVIWKRRGRS